LCPTSCQKVDKLVGLSYVPYDHEDFLSRGREKKAIHSFQPSHGPNKRCREGETFPNKLEETKTIRLPDLEAPHGKPMVRITIKSLRSILCFSL